MGNTADNKVVMPLVSSKQVLLFHCVDQMVRHIRTLLPKRMKRQLIKSQQLGEILMYTKTKGQLDDDVSI
jgi:hypothetical protein